MKKINIASTIKIYWKVWRGANKVSENFDSLNTNLKVFLVGSGNTYVTEHIINKEIDPGYDVIEIAVSSNMLEAGVYDLKAIWKKNDGRDFVASRRSGVFGISLDGEVKEEEIRLVSYVESFGSDGLSAYETAVMRNLNNGISSEVKWVGNEAKRIADEAARDVAEKAREEAEIAREGAEAKRVDTFNTNEETRQNTFETNEANRGATFTSNETNRENAYLSSEQDREVRFAAAEENRNKGEAIRQAAFEGGESNRATTFTRNEESRQRRFEDEVEQRAEAFNAYESSRQRAFEQAERDRGVLFRSKEDAREADELKRDQAEAIRNTQESVRQQAEQIRIDTFDENERGRIATFNANEEARIAAENERKQKEAEREANEAIRKESYKDKLPVSAVVQETGDSADLVMSQKAVSEEITSIVADVLVGENTTLWINAEGILNTTLPDNYGSNKYDVEGVVGEVEISTPLEGNAVVSMYTLVDGEGRTITYGETTDKSSHAVLDLSLYSAAKFLYVSYAVENKATVVKKVYDFKRITNKLASDAREQDVRFNSMYYDAKSEEIPLVESVTFEKGGIYSAYNAGQTFRNKTLAPITFNTIKYFIKASSSNDIVRVFKVSSGMWNGEYLLNKQFTDTSYFTKIYESIVDNVGSDSHTIIMDSVVLQPNESVFVVVFGANKTDVQLTSTYEKGNKNYGYPLVFSLEANVDGNIFCYFGYNEYSTYPMVLSLSPPYCLKKDLPSVREIIEIKRGDSEIVILHKMLDAYTKGNCDVVWEKGVYEFSEIYTYMQDTLGWDWGKGKGLPIGSGCRYFFNDSTLISNPANGYSSTRNILDSVPNEATSFELYDGHLINNGGTYCVHDEGNAKETPYVHLYKNMRMRYDAQGVGTGSCIGAGTGFDSMIKIEDCYFWTNKDNGYPIGIHGVVNNPNNKSVKLTLFCSNSYFSQASISFNMFSSERDDVFVQFCNNRTTLDFDGKSGLRKVLMWNNNK